MNNKGTGKVISRYQRLAAQRAFMDLKNNGLPLDIVLEMMSVLVARKYINNKQLTNLLNMNDEGLI